jgi:hypothetical protein
MSSDTPETDAFLRDLNDYSDIELRAMTEHARKLERERDEALMDRANGDIATMTRNHYERILRERDEVLAKIKELFYIAGRAIDLAEIDFENDKFGVVSELRHGLEKIQEGAK